MSRYCSECTYLDLTSGNSSGDFWCEKRLERHRANDIECSRFCEAYSRSSSEANSAYEYSKNHSGSSGCYLTTMLCDILKLPDNNPYLNIMRSFRDNVLQKNEKYINILAEYDIIGPEISKCLNNDPLKYKISAIYFYKYIKPIINFIKNKNYIVAVNLYIEMTNSLKALYSININITTLEIDNLDIKNAGHGKYIKKSLQP